MNLPVIPSTFFLTLLMMIGLFFFIRASVKDRTKQITLVPEESADISVEKLRSYFESRAYQLTSINAQDKEVAFKGYVQPSLFLAILLSLLATVGLSCLVLVLALLLPQSSVLLWLLLAIAPLAGVFYWRKAGRWEKILLKVTSSAEERELVTVTAHRDELLQLQENLSIQTLN